MALKAGSKYLNTNVPVAGTPVTTVATTSIPMPNADGAAEVLSASTGPITIASGGATTDTWRAFILPANCIVVDLALDVVTGNGAAGSVQFGVLGQNAASVDGGVALTLDAIAANSAFTQAQVTTAAGCFRRTTAIPKVTTDAVTRNASVGVPVPYDRVIGFTTPAALVTTSATIDATLFYTAA